MAAMTIWTVGHSTQPVDELVEREVELAGGPEQDVLFG